MLNSSSGGWRCGCWMFNSGYDGVHESLCYDFDIIALALSLGLSYFTGMVIFDSIGSILVGGNVRSYITIRYLNIV